MSRETIHVKHTCIARFTRYRQQENFCFQPFDFVIPTEDVPCNVNAYKYQQLCIDYCYYNRKHGNFAVPLRSVISTQEDISCNENTKQICIVCLT